MDALQSLDQFCLVERAGSGLDLDSLRCQDA
jgi:hypothetical protein